jgi:hypothetical protein
MQGYMNFRGVGSAAGALLTGLGMFFLYNDLVGAAGVMAQLLGNGSGGIEILPTAAVVAPHLTHTLCFIQHLALAGWPLLLVIAGTMLSRESGPNEETLSGK